jgi:hypothetical protein
MNDEARGEDKHQVRIACGVEAAAEVQRVNHTEVNLHCPRLAPRRTDVCERLNLDRQLPVLLYMTELAQEQRGGAWSMRDHTVSKCDCSHRRLVGQIVEA